MGFKIRAGMAVGGLAISYFFGLSFLSGLASQLDTTGNILVDIADGIGLVSKVTPVFSIPNIDINLCFLPLNGHLFVYSYLLVYFRNIMNLS
jgi:hypothetical protein